MRRDIEEGKVRVYDSSVNVWEEPIKTPCTSEYEARFYEDVFAQLTRFLRRRGWHVKRDEGIHRHYRRLDKTHRYCTHPSRLEAKLETHGRHLKFEMFQNVANVSNSYGGRYDFNQLERMPYPLRLRARVEIREISRWLCDKFGYSFDPGEKDHGPGPYCLSVDEWILQHYRTRSFRDKREEDDEIHDYNKEGRDGLPLRNDATAWFTDRKGRWLRGVIEHNINNMWWVKLNRYALRNEHSGAIQLRPPPNPRVKDNARQRRCRLEDLMRQAASNDDFVAAEKYKRILFGDSKTDRIKHREKGWYGPQCGGYASERESAGRYTEAEAAFALARPEEFHVEVVGG